MSQPVSDKIVGEDRKQHFIHGVPVGPSRDGIAAMVLQDAMDNQVKKFLTAVLSGRQLSQ